MIEPVPPAVHGRIALKALIVATSWVLEFYALRHLALSVAAPVRASQPFFTLLGAVWLFDERMSVLRWGGVLMTLASYLAFSVSGVRGVRTGGKGKWILCSLGAALVGAVSSLYDKHLFNRLGLPPLAVQCWYTLYIVILLAVVLALCWRPAQEAPSRFRWRWSIPCIGICLAASDTLYFHALHEPDALVAMLAAIRRANVAIGFAAGIFWFGESGGGRRTLALAGILGGVIMMTLG